MTTLVDSNVILDLFTQDPVWRGWSLTALARAADSGSLAINPVIYGEISGRFSTIEAFEATLAPLGFDRLPLPWTAAFVAAKSHQDYRRRGGARTSILPDFYIGAHAAVAGLTLLTRDATRYRSYFPRLTIIAPN